MSEMSGVNGKKMKSLSIALLGVCFTFLTVSFFFPSAAVAGFDGSRCLKCHEGLKGKISEEKAHKPIKDGKCFGCHNPHASNYDGLLSAPENKICLESCHEDVNRKLLENVVVHRPAKEGKCMACHDPHSSSNDNLLVKSGKNLCFDCHEEKKLLDGKFKHKPVRQGKCIICHDPHSSTEESLVRGNGASLCFNNACHNTSKESLQKSHYGFNVFKSNCAECHNPHASNDKNLLKNNLHKPVAERKCNDCHTKGKNGEIGLKVGGIDHCYSCHKDTAKSFEKINTHFVPTKENSCLNCHSPHASNAPGLLAGKEKIVCFRCHDDTERRMREESSEFKHPEIEKCSDCHSPHGSDFPLFLRSSENETCSHKGCHEGATSFSHPVGEETIDKRNNRRMTCLTCHDPMGAPYKKHLVLEPTRELCEQCHNL